MQVIHFTAGATDPLVGSHHVGCVPLLDTAGSAQLCCLHLKAGSRLPSLPAAGSHALLVLQAKVLASLDPPCRLEMSAGVGAVLEASERCALESARGAIALVVEASELEAHVCGISTPTRIAGARWPGEDHERSSG